MLQVSFVPPLKHPKKEGIEGDGLGLTVAFWVYTLKGWCHLVPDEGFCCSLVWLLVGEVSTKRRHLAFKLSPICISAYIFGVSRS